MDSNTLTLEENIKEIEDTLENTHLILFYDEKEVKETKLRLEKLQHEIKENKQLIVKLECELKTLKEKVY